MSFKDCINRGVAGGDMDPKRAEQVLRQYESLFRQFENTMGPTQADFQAARHIIDRTKREAAERRRVMQLQAAATRSKLERMETHRNMRGEFSPGKFLEDMISNRRGAGGSTIFGKYETIRRQARREMTAALRSFSANLIGNRRNRERLQDVVRAVFREDVKDPQAKHIAEAWGRVSERLRTRFNAAGGHIGKREDWGLPQAHDSKRIRRAGYEEWRSYILPRLDLEAMGRDFNDGVPFTPETIEILMRDAFEAIRTDGYSRRSPAARHGSAMYNRRADHRFFKFKTADGWIEYNDRFGAGEDAFRIMLGHIDTMANEIALMEELGPNPNHGFQFLTDAAMSMAQRSPDADLPERTTRRIRQAENMMDALTGRVNIPGNAKFAYAASAVRQYLTSAHLGSAIISSVTDFNTQRVAAGFIGMSRVGFLKQMGRLMRDADFRNDANEAGLIFENAMMIGNAAARYEMENLHVEGAARLADFTIRASGLGYLTEVQRQSFGLEFMSSMARKWRGQAYGDMDPKLRRVLADYGIREREWQIMQEAPLHTTSNGLQILRAQEIEEAGFQDVADLYMEAVVSLTEFAVPSTDLYGRAMVLGNARAGTLGGEFIRSALQFKAFPITVITTQISRVLNEAFQGRSGSAAGYAASLFIGATLLGGVAIQLKEISKGRDPRDMTDPKFWVAAMAQGGGLGIFGDFLFNDVNRFGQGLGTSLVGPSIGFADDVLRFSVGNVQEVIMGESTNIGREFTNLLRRYTPGGSLWYARLAFEREVLDRIQAVLDPNVAASFDSRRRYPRQTFGNEFFAPPGEGLAGARAPNFGAAIGADR